MGVKGALLTSIAAYSAVNTCRFLVHVYRAWILNKIPGPSSNSLLWGQVCPCFSGCVLWV